MSEHSQTIFPASSGTAPRSVDATRFDYERYRQHLDHLDMPEAARQQLGEALWTFLRGQVDRAWGDDPVQLARRDVDQRNAICASDPVPVIGSDDQQQTD